MDDIIENKTFDEIAVGDSASLSRAFRRDDLDTWAAVTGNIGLVHAYEAAVREGVASEGGGHNTWGTALLSTIIGTQLPGAGTIIRSSNLRYVKPLAVGTRVMGTVTVAGKGDDHRSVVLDCRCTDAHGEETIVGTVEVIAPAKKLREAVGNLPQVQLRRGDRYLELLKRCEGLPAATTAVVHPCSDDALSGAIQAAERGLITPVLVGPEARIKAIAEAEGIDISPYRLVPAEHSHHAAEQAVAMVRSGEAELLMKGSLHTDELMEAVVSRTAGLRTERRISHAFIIDVATYSDVLIVTDGAINIAPSLEDKRDICQNAIDLAHALGIETPKVAILSAVETVTGRIPSTLDAASLCKMADRGQITGALLDGPLAFDNAISKEAARIKGIVSPVAGQANILVVPDLEAGNILAKQITFMTKADAAGLVLGARVPIILTSRADTRRTKLASCAIAAIMAHYQRTQVPKVPKTAAA